MAALTAAQLNTAHRLATNMASKRRQTTPRWSGMALHLGQAIGNVRFMHHVMNAIEANNLSVLGPSAGPNFLSSRSKTGIDSDLQSLLTISEARICRTEGRDTFYELVRRLVPPEEFFRAFLFHPAHQAVALAAGLINNAILDQGRLRRQIARARDRRIGLDELEDSDNEDEDSEGDSDAGSGGGSDGGDDGDGGGDAAVESGQRGLALPGPGKAPVKRKVGRPRKHPIVPENIKEKHSTAKKRGRKPTSRIQPRDFGG